MAVASEFGFALALIWVLDVHLNHRFNNLIGKNIVIISRFPLDVPPSSIKSNDRAISSVGFYDFMRHESNKRVDIPEDVLVNSRDGPRVYVKKAYIVQSRWTPRIILYSSAFLEYSERNISYNYRC